MVEVRPQLVATGEAMGRFLVEIERQDRIAVDTEANPMHAYRERLCLFQVSTPDRDYLVDPLADLDLSDFLAVLADPEITKVFHDAEYDILQIQRTFGARVAGLFDTKVAAVAVGEPAIGLAPLVERYFDVKLDKSQQRSNWGRRPLAPAQIEYASLDVHFLLPLADLLERKLQEIEPIAAREVESELRRLEVLVPVEKTDRNGWQRIKGTNRFSPEQLRVVSDLYTWREREAERRDKPPFKILSNSILVAIAASGARTNAELADSGALPHALHRRFGKAVAQVLREAADKPGLERPRGEKQSKAQRQRAEEDQLVIDRLKRWRKRVADARPTDPSLILNREVLEALAAHRPRPRSRDELVATGLLEDWRIEAHCDAVLAAIAGESE